MSARYDRVAGRKRKRDEASVVSALLTLNKVHKGDIEAVSECTDSLADTDCSYCDDSVNLEDVDSDIVQVCSGHTSGQGIQTTVTCQQISDLECDNRARVVEEANRRQTCSVYDREMYVDAPEKASFYTGLPGVEVLDMIFNLIDEHMVEHSILTKYQQMLLCLIKLRMNYLFRDIAYQLNVSPATVQRYFHSTLDVMYVKLSFVIRWPERAELRKSMPMCFRAAYQNKVVVIIDCFELFTEKPSGALNQVQTYSNYKHHQTVKYLIGIAPQGMVTFISNGWGGRTSDKHIVEKSGLLNNLLPGDILMADRGFKISDDVAFYQAKLVIPDFTKGKKQLHPLEVENTRKIANVRIHVERVIGLVVRKFRIFDGEIPLEFLKLKQGETTPTIDKVVRVCCALSCLCPSVVPFE